MLGIYAYPSNSRAFYRLKLNLWIPEIDPINFSTYRSSHSQMSQNILHYSQKNSCVGVLFNFIKKRLQHRVYTCEYFDVFKNSRFHRTPLVAASAPNCGNLTLLREINPYSYLSPDDFSLLMLLNIVFVQKTSSRRFSRKTISW